MIYKLLQNKFLKTLLQNIEVLYSLASTWYL